MLAPNSLLQNRYLIVRSIGQGGMGAVYLARDQRLGNTVALKETFFTDARMRRALEREARLLAHLRHPALPKVIDHFGEGEGQFLVMEFIPGDDLEVLLAQRGQPFGVERVLHWAYQLLDALEYLHTQETPVLHRDIKPANLKLTSRDQIILLDFGLAKGEAGQMTSVATSRSVLGFTPNFAPLEQIQGTGTDPRSDLYSLGATLYYLLTGVIPVNAVHRATASVSELPDPLTPANEVNTRIAPAIANVLHQAVALNPNRRPGSATEMRHALVEASSLSSVGTSESKTVVLEPTEALVPPKPEPQKTMASPLPPVPRPTIPSPTPPPPPQPSPLFESPAPKPRRLPWILGGIAALVLVGIALTVFVVIYNSTRTTQWQDTKSNRQADQTAGVAARVSGKPILLSEVDKVVNMQAGDQKGNLSPLQLKQARLQALDSLIQREALVQRAEKEQLTPTDDEITAAIEERKKASGMTENDLQAELKKQSMSMETLREEARKDLAIKRLQDKWSAKLMVSDKEIEDFYEKNKAQFNKKRGVALSAIAADPANNEVADDAKTKAAAKLKIDSLYQQLKSGRDFATLARDKSEHASHTEDGDIGFATEKDLKDKRFSEDLIRQFFYSMSIGEITSPTPFSGGRWFIFKLTQRNLQDENFTLDSPGVRQQISKGLLEQRKEISNTELLTTTLNEAKVVNYLAAGNSSSQQ